MKLDFSQPDQLQTRDGRPVRIYSTDAGGNYPIHGSIFHADGNRWELCSWSDAGQVMRSTESLGDVVRKPVRVTGWLNVYENFNFLAPKFGDVVYETQQLARENVSSKNVCLGQIYVDSEIIES